MKSYDFSDAQRDTIRNHAARDRSQTRPLYFAGRREELDRLFRRFRQPDLEGAITLVHGIPGSGKTALLREFKDLAEKQRIPVVQDVADLLSHPYELAACIAAAQRRKRPNLDRIDRASKVKVDLKAFKASRSDQRHRAGSEILQTAFAASRVKRNKPVILLADECQNLPEDAGPGLYALHKGLPGYRVHPVLAGTNRLPTRLAEIGPDRLSQGGLIHLHQMPLPAAWESVYQSSLRLGLDVADAAALAPLSADTHGFPFHINAAIAGICKVLVDHDFRLPANAPTLSRHEAAAYRSDYYKLRHKASGMPIEMLAVLAAASRRSSEVHLGTVHEECEQALRNDAEVIGEEPLKFHDCILAADVAGVIDYDRETRTFKFLVPSMTSWALDRSERFAAAFPNQPTARFDFRNGKAGGDQPLEATSTPRQ